MKIDLEIYETIRKLYLHEQLSQRAIARKLGISRNTVAKYVNGSNVPWERKAYSSLGGTVITKSVESFIHKCFEEDSSHNHDKQKHTAKRIFDRLVDEQDFKGSYTSVRRAVARLRQKTKPAFVPLAFDPAEAAQVDFGTAYIYLAGQQCKIKYFCMRLCYSSHIFAKAYLVEKEECFLDGLVSAFEFFSGVPKSILFDNAKVAVSQGYGTHVTKITPGYQAVKSHYAFETLFCNPRSGNEKGLVENLVGLIRRNAMVPMPRVDTMEQLNNLLEARCTDYLSHKIQGQVDTVGTNFKVEQQLFLPLPAYRYDSCKNTYAVVNSFSTVTYETNKYSVPTKFIGKEVLIKAYPSYIEILYSANSIAVHTRSFLKHKSMYEIEHYLEVLEHKPRAIFNAQPVRSFVPKEILEEYKKRPNGNKELLAHLKDQIDHNASKDIGVSPIQLNHYDTLIKGVEA